MTKTALNKRLDRDGNRLYDCPVCGQGTVTVGDNVFYGRCDTCDATMIDYIPLEHQRAFHESNAQYRLNIGGFGSGKTTAACAEAAIHAMSTPNGRFLITAPILTQVKEAVLPELDKFIPPWFIAKKVSTPSPYYELKNGHEILVFASNDQQKLRSLNLTGFYIEEASGVDYEIFDQLMTRLRNKAGVVKDIKGDEIGYKFMGILSTNPEDGWIKDKFLLISDKVVASPSIDLQVYKPLMNREDTNRHFHTFISSTRDNHHVPAEFIERMTAGKPLQWIRKYVDCYLDFKEGAVYPDFMKHLVEPFDIPKSWKRIAGFDPGYNDPTAFVMGAIDPKTNVVYVYEDYKVGEQPVSYHADRIKPLIMDLPFAFPIQADPSVQKRNERDGISYADYFRRIHGIRLEPGNNDILYGIEKVRDYFYAGRLKVFNNCNRMKEEANKYSYPKDKYINSNDRPIDKNNHLMDALRYMIAALPKDPHVVSRITGQLEFFGQKRTYIESAFKGDIKSDDNRQRTVVGGLKL